MSGVARTRSRLVTTFISTSPTSAATADGVVIESYTRAAKRARWAETSGGFDIVGSAGDVKGFLEIGTVPRNRGWVPDLVAGQPLFQDRVEATR